MGEMRCACRILVGGELREGDHLQDPGVDGRKTLTRILKELDGVEIDWIDLAQDMDSWQGSCECGNELSGSIKCAEFAD
jgi:hypothetical protein